MLLQLYYAFIDEPAQEVSTSSNLESSRTEADASAIPDPSNLNPSSDPTSIVDPVNGEDPNQASDSEVPESQSVEDLVQELSIGNSSETAEGKKMRKS